MPDAHMTSKRDTMPARMLGVIVAGLILAAAAGPAVADNPATLGEALKVRETDGPSVSVTRPEASEAEAASARLAETWGVEVASIRLSANDHMIDYRYRVLDAGKATDLFKRQIKPYLIHQKTEKVLSVPETAKLGPLRNSNLPQEGKIYWMFFGNAGMLVQPGDEVTVVIGDFRVENLVVN